MCIMDKNNNVKSNNASYKVIKSENLSSAYEERYVIVCKETNEILDDAQGYGYKTKQRAHASYAYKNRD